MKLRVFLIVCVGSILILVMSSAMVFTQMRAVRAVNLEPLIDTLYEEDAKILSWILSAVPADRLASLRLPESWAEIFLVDTGDLQLKASTTPAHSGMPLYRHPLLLDQARVITEAMRTGSPSVKATPSYMVVIEPAGEGQILVALKPKAWEQRLVAKQAGEIEARTRNIVMVLAAFLAAGMLLALAISFAVTRMVVTPTRKIMDALEALSLGDFEHDMEEAPGKDMAAFTESYLRLKASLEIALEMIARR